MRAALPSRAIATLDFWFGHTWDEVITSFHAKPICAAPIPQNFKLWFGGTPEIDSDIRAKFGSDVEAATRGDYLAAWTSDKYSCLALIILLDQFALNIYRDDPKSFNSSALAIPLTYKMVEAGWDRELPFAMQMFTYLPLEHSELLKDQEKSVELNAAAVDALKAAGAEESLIQMASSVSGYAVEHYDVVKKYGRFPGRNAVHGRLSTADELQYLADGGVF